METTNNSKTAHQYLLSDPTLKPIIKQVGVIPSARNEDIYYYLLRSIVSQQLSVKAAATIFGRFLDLFENNYPIPSDLVIMEEEKLRGVGLSRQKLSYLKNVAEFSMKEPMDFPYLDQMDDEDVIRHLTTIKGVGKWTVQMILMFPMDRPDVFPVDDLGIQNGMKQLYGINREKKELRKAMIKIADQWSPYRSLACKYVWKSLHNTPNE